MPARKLFRITSVLIDDGVDQDDDYDDAWEEVLCYRISSNQPRDPTNPPISFYFDQMPKSISALSWHSQKKLKKERKLL